MKIIKSSETRLADLVARQTVATQDVASAVQKIVEDVKNQGDQAVKEYTATFDGVQLTDLKVTDEEKQAALSQVDEQFLKVLKQAKQNIQAFHQKQLRQGFVTTEETGTVMGQRLIPLTRVGVYVPGGTAAYPSTVLMDVLPAKIAGVEELVMVTPPQADGCVNPIILAAAEIAGVDEIYKVGGAQSIAALAYGTESIPAVDKIVGPGNIYVATAKRQVYGRVDIDMIAGPSDVLIVADESGNPQFLAADLLAQAEHDQHAQAILVTTDYQLAEATLAALKQQLASLPRQKIAQTSIENNGKIIYVETLNEAIELANAFAPEHLELAVAEPFALLGKVKNAGSVFLGHYTPEVLGDYYAGPNHTLPTEGTSRFYSALSVDDFVKRSSYLYYPKEATQAVAKEVIFFAEQEGLSGHARSMARRLEE